ncbi:MAG: hypothetical protein BroJett013_02370 [Alphaproteobacteria bacterium]|nr:MAG: hypothetical protein BroJett013_02370 [Alphaproteobacteria bacterium]
MASNLFIAYDLISPGQNYDAVRDAIKSLGQWHQFQYSLFYVHTQHSAWDAWHIVWAAMDPNDRLAVIDANAGVTSNWDHPPTHAINSIWNQA